MLILVPALFIIKRKKLRLENLFGLAPVWRELGLFSNGLKIDLKRTIGLFFVLIAVALAASFVLLYIGLHDLENVSVVVSRISLPVLAYLIVVRGISEEIFFRGFLVKRIGVLGSSLIFALAHIMYFSVAEVIGTFVLGLLLALAFRKNRNLVPNIFAHMLYNIFALSFLAGF